MDVGSGSQRGRLWTLEHVPSADPQDPLAPSKRSSTSSTSVICVARVPPHGTRHSVALEIREMTKAINWITSQPRDCRPARAWQVVVVLSLTIIRMVPVALCLLGSRMDWPTVAFRRLVRTPWTRLGGVSVYHPRGAA